MKNNPNNSQVTSEQLMCVAKVFVVTISNLLVYLFKYYSNLMQSATINILSIETIV